MQLLSPMNFPTISVSNAPFKLFFYIGWTVFGLVQAWSTDLFHDEAFYWFCSQKMSWGYLEQPPMVNLLIYLGNFFIPNELGTRIIFVLLNTFSIYLLERIVKPKNFALFIALILSVGVLSIGGFLAMSDNALIFFTATFFLLYKRYTDEDSFLYTVLLGLNVAAILYSKHYGLLIFIFVVASNVGLFKRKSFYAIIAISVGLLLPAILWQSDHDFISLNYHLADNLTSPYSIDRTAGFLIRQIIFMGPLIGILFLYSSFRYKSENKFDAALKYTLFGILGFFLLATFQVKVLPHWTSAAIIPMIILSYKFLESDQRLSKWLLYLLPVNVLFVVVLRLYFAVDFVPKSWELKTELHNWDAWAEEMDNISEGKPLIFLDDDIVKYNYYSKNTAYVLDDISGRRTQYDLWDTEQELQGKTVVLISKNKHSLASDSLSSILGGKYYYGTIDNFQSYSKVKIEFKEHEFSAVVGESWTLPIRYNETYEHEAAEVAPQIGIHTFSGGELLESINSGVLISESMNDGEWIDLNIEAPDEPGFYEIRLSVSDDMMPPTINSNIIELRVKEAN